MTVDDESMDFEEYKSGWPDRNGYQLFDSSICVYLKIEMAKFFVTLFVLGICGAVLAAPAPQQDQDKDQVSVTRFLNNPPDGSGKYAYR